MSVQNFRISQPVFSKYTSYIVLGLVLVGLYVTSWYSYLLFHSLVEIFSIVIGFSIFIIAWNAKNVMDNGYLLFAGIGMLFVSLFDMVHALAYKGMGVFPEYTADLPTQLWIASRYLFSLSLMIAPFYLRRKFNPHMVFAVFAILSGLTVAAIFVGGIFPVTFVEGGGQTVFKKTSELVISFFLLIDVFLLLRFRQEFDRGVLNLLIWALLANLTAELAFTAYLNVYDFTNMLGHLFKTIGYFLFYRSLVFTGLAKPYNLLFLNLKRQEEDLRQLNLELEERVHQRTEALERANAELQAEVVERRRAEAELQKYRDHLEELVSARTADLQREVRVRERAEAEVSRYATELERSNRDLQDFAFIASHDLQEPLRKILAFGDRLKTNTAPLLGEHELDYLERMLNAATRMQAMIDGLLAYSRVNSKGRALERVDLNQVLSEVLSDLELRIERSGGKVLCENLPEVEADALQMRQLFQNLIGNALKFHRANVPPVVRVSSSTQEQNGQGRKMVQIAVEDNGIGFDESDLGKLFQPFYRLHSRNQYEGSGIGLAICRKIVERHGGFITARSALGAGTTFFVTLPLCVPEPVPAPEA